jgi:hypothetical protein
MGKGQREKKGKILGRLQSRMENTRDSRERPQVGQKRM